MEQPYLYIEDQYPYPPVQEEAVPEEDRRGVAVVWPPAGDEDNTVIIEINEEE